MISRSGVTAARKNWGDGSEARAFVAAMRRASKDWRFISMDDEDLGEGVAGFRALFGDLDEPFARLYKALTRRVDLFVGIPAGPLHFTMAAGAFRRSVSGSRIIRTGTTSRTRTQSISSVGTCAIARSIGVPQRRRSRPRSSTGWSISTRTRSPSSRSSRRPEP